MQQYAANAAWYHSPPFFFMIAILNNPQSQSFMQIYPKNPDLGSMLQFGLYAAA